jgi:hypothetical protein
LIFILFKWYVAIISVGVDNQIFHNDNYKVNWHLKNLLRIPIDNTHVKILLHKWKEGQKNRRTEIFQIFASYNIIFFDIMTQDETIRLTNHQEQMHFTRNLTHSFLVKCICSSFLSRNIPSDSEVLFIVIVFVYSFW